MAKERHCVFVAGGTGCMGQRLIPLLLKRGHEVRTLVRSGSEKKLPAGCTPVLGNALDGASYAGQISPADPFVQLVGVAHPNPAKAAEFREGTCLQDWALWRRRKRQGFATSFI